MGAPAGLMAAWFDQQPEPALLIADRSDTIVAINATARALLNLDDGGPIGTRSAAFAEARRAAGQALPPVQAAYPIDFEGEGYRILILDRACSTQPRITPLAPTAQADEEVTRTLLAALDHANDFVLVLTPSHDAEFGARKILYANETYLRVTGFSRDEIVGQRPLALLSPRNTPDQVVHMRGVLNAHCPARGELWLRAKSGDDILVETESTPLVNDQGEVSYWLLIHRPITEQRAQQEQIRLLFAAADQANDFILVMTRDRDPVLGGRKITYVNQTYLTRTGYSRDEVVGVNSTALYGDRNPPYVIQSMREAADRGEVVQADLWMRAKNGEQILVAGSAVPVRAADGAITHWLVVQRPIDAQCREETAMRLIKERTQLIGRAATDAIWDSELGGGSIWWNENFRVLLGHDPTDFAATLDEWAMRVVPEDRPRVRANTQRVLAGAADDWSLEYRFARPDGSIAVLSDHGFVIRDKSGAPARLIGTIVDITHRRMVEERLQQAQKLEALGQMTGGLAHDFNNLLTVVIGSAEAMIDVAPAGTNLAELASTTLKAAERGAELTNRLLSFGRRQSLSPGSIDCAQLVQGMRPLLRSTLPETIRIDFVAADQLWPALVDPGQLEVALLNLAMNARDAMPSGGCFTVSIETQRVPTGGLEGELAPGDYVRIAVNDTGCGMSPETLRRAFDPFFTTKEVGKGTGLGLSMVYGFAKQSGGTATIETEAGRGTTVSLYLPRARRRAVANRRETHQPLVGGSETILIVEDDAMVRAYAAMALRHLGYSVIEAEDGHAAQAVVERGDKVDLLFCDIVMPGGMDGLQVAEVVRKIRNDIKILFTTGYANSVSSTQYALGSLLRKPYRRDEMARAIREAIDGATIAID